MISLLIACHFYDDIYELLCPDKSRGASKSFNARMEMGSGPKKHVRGVSIHATFHLKMQSLTMSQTFLSVSKRKLRIEAAPEELSEAHPLLQRSVQKVSPSKHLNVFELSQASGSVSSPWQLLSQKIASRYVSSFSKNPTPLRKQLYIQKDIL